MSTHTFALPDRFEAGGELTRGSLGLLGSEISLAEAKRG
jgi:hypothetical protein